MVLKDHFQAVRARWAVQALREEIRAVDTAGLGRLLESGGIRQEFERGEMECRFCRKPVDESTVYALFRESGDIKAVCIEPTCIARFLQWIEGHLMILGLRMWRCCR